jgi:hypothetical protein
MHKLGLDTWLVGNIAEHIQLGGIFRSHEKYAKEYGPIFVARNVHKPIVMVESPDLARKVPRPALCRLCTPIPDKCSKRIHEPFFLLEPSSTEQTSPRILRCGSPVDMQATLHVYQNDQADLRRHAHHACGWGCCAQVLLQNNYRCVFPNLLHGRDAAFEESTYLDTRDDKLRVVRGAWQPFFFSGRRA